MSVPDRDGYLEANRRWLAAALAELGERLGGEAADRPVDRALAAAGAALPGPPALDVLAETFGLSAFERGLVLLAAGPELDADFARRCTAAGGAADGRPTFSLALAALPGAHWSALSPGAPLRWWRLVEPVGDGPLTARPLAVDERVLHFLAGVQHLDERLAGLVEPFAGAPEAIPSQRALAGRIAALWEADGGGTPGVDLHGDPRAATAVAAALAEALGRGLATLAAEAVPTAAAELDGLVRLWSREAALTGAALLVDTSGDEADDPARRAAVGRLIDRVGGAVVVVGRERRRPGRRPLVSFPVGRPDAGEQRELWRRTLGEAAAGLDGALEAVVGHFALGADEIAAAGAEALAGGNGDGRLGARLWSACRRQARPQLAGLAERIEPAAVRADLVLPERARATLDEMAVHVRRRRTVHESWGWRERSGRGLGVATLFTGASGTGKTMAAEVLAGELGLDLYRIDLARVVSKYIGETEKNLARVFAAAEGGGAILLFDEADALFGKRSEVKDSHDRYANLEISYLLQRMETYRGLAILTTNQRSALDPAFLRRLRFVVEFPFPDEAARAEIWRRIFPAATPTEGLAPDRLARLALAGGNIRNVALAASFSAAESGGPVRMAHLLAAARGECAKLERPLSEADVRGWVE